MQRKPVFSSLCFIFLFAIAISIGKDGQLKEIEYPEQKTEVSVTSPEYLQPGSNVIISWEVPEDKALKAEFGGTEIPIVQIGNKMFCLASLGVRKPSGLYNFTLYEKDINGEWQNCSKHSLFFDKMNTRRRVLAKEGKKRKGFLKQYLKEREVINQVMSTSVPNALFTMPFSMPLKKMTVTGAFGTRRYYNNTKRTSIHAGVDLRAKTPTDVYAINTGKVILAREFTLEGNFVAIDHGANIISFYMHLSKLHVKEGDEIKRGAILGLSGQTGNCRGAHLHFSVRIHKGSVNPLEFIEMINKHLSSISGSQ